MTPSIMFLSRSSAQTTLTPLSSDNIFHLECTGLNKAERDRLVGFFMQMRGRFGAFRFEPWQYNFSNAAVLILTLDPIWRVGAGPHNINVPIKVLRG